MIFLIEYNQSQGRLVTFREFDDSRKQEAWDARLELELALHRQGIEHEIVLLEAANEEALHKTHERYFGIPGLSALSRIIPEKAP